MKIYTPTQLAALRQPTVPIVQLVHMDLANPLYLNPSSWSIPWSGHLWLGTGALGAIEEVTAAPGEVKGLRFSMSGIAREKVAEVLSEPVARRAVTVYTAVLDHECKVAICEVEWAGYLEPQSIQHSGDQRVVSVTAEHWGIDLLRPRGVRCTHAEQQRLHPGDMGLEFQAEQATKSVIWPARQFFFK